MKKLRIICTTIFLLSFVFVWLALFCPHLCMAENVASEKQTITISKEQFNKQSEILMKQEQVLVKLKWRMSLLETPLTEQIKLLEKCENELTEAKLSLEKQTNSLTSAYNTIEKLKQDLKILEEQIKQSEKKSKRRAVQRDVAIVLLFIAIFI